MNGKEVVRKIAEENIGMLRSFSRKHCRAIGKTPDELMSLLSLNYMKSISDFLRDQPAVELSTYVYNGFKWEFSAILEKRRPVHSRLIHVPGLNQKTKEIRAKAEQAIRLIHFHGSEGKCNDSALLHHDADIWKNEEYRILIEKAMLTLPLRDASILRLRYGFPDSLPVTLEETGKIVGITRERVRQLEVRGLKKLQSQLDQIASKLHDYDYWNEDRRREFEKQKQNEARKREVGDEAQKRKIVDEVWERLKKQNKRAD